MSAWQIDRDSVSADLLDGEVVAIHLATGIYYSLRGSAAVLWQALDRPNDVAGLAAALAAHYDVPADQAALEAEAFAAKLAAEKLVLPAAAAEPVPPPAPAAERRPFAPPALERYADLQDLLLLDPIHDVGEFGWPHKPADPK